jgi:E3 ubiquitin-protein ligase listerin
MDLLPSKEKIDSMLSMFPTKPADASISLRSQLLPLSGFEGPPTEEIFDLDGYSSYARIISLLLDAFSGDRIFAKAHPWALRHFVALSIYAEEVADLPNSSCGVFDAKAVPSSALQELIHKVQQVTTYVLSDAGDGQSWHQQVTALCADPKSQHDVGEIGKFVVSMFGSVTLSDNPRDARVLHTILQHILSHTSKEEGEMWMGVCRRIETKGEQASYPLNYDAHTSSVAPFASMAVALSVAGSGSEPLRLDRYRNELAANAMGVRPAKINTEGLWILRRLVVTAPDPDSDVVFIPQARAVNFMKACQHWVTSDEDIEEEVESEMTILFFHLVPILQHVAGSHWDFIFDVVENNLEVGDLPLLSGTMLTAVLRIAVRIFLETNLPQLSLLLGACRRY